MSAITSLTNPTVFSAAPALPTGYIYQLESTGSTYTFGQKNPIYQISVIRQSDSATVSGTPFYPYDGYPDAQTMVNTECNNTYTLWLSYYNQDNLTTSAKSLIGF